MDAVNYRNPYNPMEGVVDPQMNPQDVSEDTQILSMEGSEGVKNIPLFGDNPDVHLHLHGGFPVDNYMDTNTNNMDTNNEDANYKGQLIEYCHSNNLPPPQFIILDSHGPEHEKTFIIKVVISPDKSWRGIGSTKKSAEQDAAQRAINFLLGS